MLSDDQVASAPILILGNKIDRPGAASEEDLMTYFNLHGQTTGKVLCSESRLYCLSEGGRVHVYRQFDYWKGVQWNPSISETATICPHCKGCFVPISEAWDQRQRPGERGILNCGGSGSAILIKQSVLVTLTSPLVKSTCVYLLVLLISMCVCLQGNVSEKELQRRPVELYMCSVLKRQGYGEGKPL